MKRVRTEGARGAGRREGTRRGARVSGEAVPLQELIAQQLRRALVAWGEAQAAISAQLTRSLAAWELAVKGGTKKEPKPARVAPEHEGMEGALQALRAGGKFSAFERATRGDWTRIAQTLHRRWQLPAGVEVEDIRQELLMAVVARRAKDPRTLLERWEPGRGTSLSRYVTWNAVVWAVRWIHDQRGVKKTTANGGSRGRDPSQVARPLSSFTREDGTSTVGEPEAPPDQEQAAECRESLASILASLRSAEDRIAIEAYFDSGGCVKEAARVLAAYEGMEFRTPRGAADVVTRALRHTQWAAKRVMQQQTAEA